MKLKDENKKHVELLKDKKLRMKQLLNNKEPLFFNSKLNQLLLKLQVKQQLKLTLMLKH